MNKFHSPHATAHRRPPVRSRAVGKNLFTTVNSIPTVDVVRRFFPAVKLKPDGSGRQKGLCPLRPEKSPSFTVYPTGFRCFGCGQHGSNIDLLLKAGLASSPLEAAKLIADRFDILTPDPRHAGGRGDRAPSVKPVTSLQNSDMTLVALAEAKHIPVEVLTGYGLTEITYNRRKVVRIPYLDSEGELLSVRFRLSLDGPQRFSWRSGDKVNIYGLERFQSAREVGWVLLVEGESDCWTAWLYGLPALGIPGKTCWRSEWAKHFDGLCVFLWEEPNAEDLSLRVSKDLPDLLIIRPPDGIKDLSEGHIQGRNVIEVIDQLKTQAIPAERTRREQKDLRLLDLRKQAAKILEANDPVRLVEKSIRRLGYGGDIRPAVIVYLSCTSRLLKMRLGTMPVHLILIGLPSAGKSYTLKLVLLLFPPEAYHEIDAGSPRALIYDDAELRHRIVIFSEADSLPAGEDNPAASAVRNMLQDHHLRYKVVERNPETGKNHTREVSKDGPSVLITSAVRRLGPQLDSRLFTLDVPDDLHQVRQALVTQAAIEIDGTQPPDPSLIAYQGYLQALGPWDVVVPFASCLGTIISKSVIAPRMLRDFGRLLSLIKSVAILRHRYRRTDEKGRMVAQIEDYETVFDLINSMYETTVTGVTPGVKHVVAAVGELQGNNEKVTASRVAQHLGINKPTASRRINIALKNGWLLNEDQRRNRYDLKVGDPLPENTGLPSPELLRSNAVTPQTESGLPPLPPQQEAKEQGWEEIL